MSGGMARSLIHQMQERGNISTRYTQISVEIFGMSILGYAPMDLVHSECLGDNILWASHSYAVQSADGNVHGTKISIINHINP